jgi:bifunctional DNA-binding transcriptional regulator/antitoxin component of YhaV-PrlF toxin-antitoxin module
MPIGETPPDDGARRPMFEYGTVPADGSVSVPERIRAAVEIEPGDLVTFRVTPDGVIEIRTHRLPTLAEAIEWDPILGPIDEAADREAWQDVAAAELFRRMDAESKDRARSALPTGHGKTIGE